MARILYVEDDSGLRDDIAYFLAKGGHEVCAVSNVRDALAKMAQEQPYDVILTDNNLMRGGGDTSQCGVDLIRFARTQGFRGPVLLVSSDGEEETRRKHADYDTLGIVHCQKGNLRVREISALISDELKKSRPDMISQRQGGMEQENT